MSASPSNAAATACPFAHPADTAAPLVTLAATPAAACPISAGAADFDPFSDGYQQDPPEYVRWARECEPIFFSPKLGYWVVTRYDDIKAIFRDNITFSPSIALEKITPTGEEANAVLASYGYAMSRTLVNEDEPAHMPRRRLLMEPFTPEALQLHEPMVRRLAREYVDRFIDSGRVDLVEDMLWEVPLTVALHFLGIPEEDMDALRQYSIAHTVNTWGRPLPQEQVAVAHAVGNFWQLAGRILAKMRLDPTGPGWMKYGIRMQALHPDIVTDSYLHSMMMAGIVAAHETTANASANGLKLLLEHPQAWRDICAEPALIPNAVDECLRHNGSVAAWRRLVTQDTTVAGTLLPSGAKLLIVTASANHDERHFPDADLFDIRRDNPAEHLTFGYGAHQCMGKNLARMEMQVFLEELTRRLPHLRLAKQDFSYVRNTSFRGPEHLWVEWQPQDNPERMDPAVRTAVAPVRSSEAANRGVVRRLRVHSVDTVANGVVKLRLVSPDGRALPGWTPGAHIEVECSAGLSRNYSLCGDPAERAALEIAVLREPAGRGGSAWVHDSVRPGDILKTRGPRNHFHFDETCTRVVFIAGGIGITPISVMARRARELGMDYSVHYSGRSLSAMAFVPQLQALHGDKLHLHVSDEGRRNDFTALLATPAPGTQIYACGPATLLEALAHSCSHWPEDALRVEHFTATKGTLDASKEAPFEVELKASGTTLLVGAGQSLLQVLRAASIDLRSDCEEGLCGTCEVAVLQGEVDHRDRVLTRKERAANDRMMACCSRAKSGRLIIDL